MMGSYPRYPKSPPFWDLVDKTDGCWIWTGYIDRAGYARYGRHGYAHRLAYEELVGPIPEGLVIDHLCRVRHCVNPEHLEPVTDRTNVVERGIGIAAQYARRAECVNGHEFTEENTRIRRNGTRVCRVCELMWGRANYSRRKDGLNERRRMKRAAS